MNNSQNNTEWRGYTLEEMRYKRAASLARCVIARQVLADRFTSVVKPVGTGLPGRAISLVSAFSGNLKTMQYIVLGYKLSKTVLSLWRRFRS